MRSKNGGFSAATTVLEKPKSTAIMADCSIANIQACKLTKLIRNDHYQSINLGSENQHFQWQSPGKLLLIGSLQFHALFHAQMGFHFSLPSQYYFTINQPQNLWPRRWPSLIHMGFHVPHATLGYDLSLS